MTIYFYRVNEPYGCFSNFSPHGFRLDGKWWPTSEHYFQAQKFAGTPYEEKVRLAKSPMEAANTGRDRRLPLRDDWEDVKDDIMRKAVLKKFQTHKEIREILLSTEMNLLLKRHRWIVIGDAAPTEKEKTGWGKF